MNRLFHVALCYASSRMPSELHHSFYIRDAILSGSTFLCVSITITSNAMNHDIIRITCVCYLFWEWYSTKVTELIKNSIPAFQSTHFDDLNLAVDRSIRLPASHVQSHYHNTRLHTTEMHDSLTIASQCIRKWRSGHTSPWLPFMDDPIFNKGYDICLGSLDDDSMIKVLINRVGGCLQQYRKKVWYGSRGDLCLEAENEMPVANGSEVLLDLSCPAEYL